jgi:hypothetical protein
MMSKQDLMKRRRARPALVCSHEGYLTVVATRMGYHARCLKCDALGPSRPNLEAAQQALLVLGARVEDRYR